MMTNSDPEGRIFLYYPYTNNGFFFLLITVFIYLFIQRNPVWADLLALVCDIKLCFVTFPCYILGQVLYLIVSIPDLCHLSYFVLKAYKETIGR